MDHQRLEGLAAAASSAASAESSEMSYSKGKKKRNRVPVSCKECKRRKIKCDPVSRHLNMACASCVRRGVPHMCVWIDDGPTQALGALAPQPTLTSYDESVMIGMKRLSARLAAVEKAIGKLPPELGLRELIEAKYEFDEEKSEYDEKERVFSAKGITYADEAYPHTSEVNPADKKHDFPCKDTVCRRTYEVTPSYTDSALLAEGTRTGTYGSDVLSGPPNYAPASDSYALGPNTYSQASGNLPTQSSHLSPMGISFAKGNSYATVSRELYPADDGGGYTVGGGGRYEMPPMSKPLSAVSHDAPGAAPAFRSHPLSDIRPGAAVPDVKRRRSIEEHDYSNTASAAAAIEDEALGFMPFEKRNKPRKSRRTRAARVMDEMPPTGLTSVNTSILMSDDKTVRHGKQGAWADKVDAWRREIMQETVAILPAPAETLELVKVAFDSNAFINISMYSFVFMPEVESFFKCNAAGRLMEVDPLWLSVLCMLLSMTRFMRADQRIVELTVGQPESFASDMQAAALLLLEAGEWRHRPQLRSLITVNLLMNSSLLEFPTDTRRISQNVVYLGAAVALAYDLGLHLLGSDPRTMPAYDPAYPIGPNVVRRQMALTVFSNLCTIDWISSAAQHQFYLCSPRHITSAEPGNYNFSDLSLTAWDVPERPLIEDTDTGPTWMKMRLANVCRQLFDTLIDARTSGRPVQYEAVLRLDKSFTDILELVPQYPEPVRWSYVYVYEATHARLLKLHRPFLMRGYGVESKYHFSTVKCLESACIIVYSLRRLINSESTHPPAVYGSLSAEIRRISAMLRMSESQNRMPVIMWFLFYHCLSALLVLFADLFRAIDTDQPEAEIDERHAFLCQNMVLFSPDRAADLCVTDDTRKVWIHGYQIISQLVRESAKRRARRAVRGTADPPFARVLFCIAQGMQDVPTENIKAVFDELVNANAAVATTGDSLRADALSSSRAAISPSVSVAPATDGAIQTSSSSTSAGETPNDGDFFSNQLRTDIGIPTTESEMSQSFWSVWTKAGPAPEGLASPNELSEKSAVLPTADMAVSLDNFSLDNFSLDDLMNSFSGAAW